MALTFFGANVEAWCDKLLLALNTCMASAACVLVCWLVLPLAGDMKNFLHIIVLHRQIFNNENDILFKISAPGSFLKQS